MATKIETPEKLARLLEPARYKVLFGGRGGAKSWNVARILLALGRQSKKRILCGREIQNSIAESVFPLLKDQITTLGFGDFYTCTQSMIRGKNGTEFIFAGLKQNISKMKSFEGIDIVWVEEAACVSEYTWSVLIPTIRKEGSEIWLTLNPELITDATYKRFIEDPPKGAILIPIGWRDNPWFPQVLLDEKDDLKEKNFELYKHVWEGEPVTALEGAVFASELAKVDLEKRITTVPYNPAKPVMTFWDLGYRDNTVLWFVQVDGQMFNVIDFYQNSFKALPFYLNVLQQKGYTYGTHYLPHDGSRHSFDTGATPEGRIQDMGMRAVTVDRCSKIQNSIDNTRMLFSRLRFDENKTFDGVQALRRFCWGQNQSREPIHNEFSHAAAALRTFGDAPYIQWNSFNTPQAQGFEQPRGRVVSDYDPLEMKEDINGNYVYS